MNSSPKLKQVECIGVSAFEGCSELESVIIGDNVTIIEGKAFAGLNKLKKVIIKNKIRKIEYSAFSGNNNLRTIIIESEIPPSINNSYPPFPNVDQVGYFIYVPKNSVETYKNAWRLHKYSSRIKAMQELEN